MPKVKKEKPNWDDVKYLMERTWDNIAPDVLGSEESGVTMRKREVIGIVLDQIAYTDKLPREQMLAFMELSIPQKQKIAKEVFTYSHYGW